MGYFLDPYKSIMKNFKSLLGFEVGYRLLRTLKAAKAMGLYCNIEIKRTG